jgi:targeting protein for Xklp2
VYANVLEVKDGEKCLTEQCLTPKEIHGFGIPASISTFWKGTAEVQPFSFDGRDQMLLTKKEEKLKKFEDEARKMQEAAQFRARPADAIHKKPFEPKESERPPTATTAELNTERTAKERAEFDAMMKAEQAKLEELRLRDEKLKEEKQEITRVRKKSVHKANPIRRYKPTHILASDKPLTDPHSPSFMSRKS